MWLLLFETRNEVFEEISLKCWIFFLIHQILVFLFLFDECQIIKRKEMQVNGMEIYLYNKVSLIHEQE